MGTAEGWVVTHDGETLKAGLQNDFEAVNWLHKRVGYSVDHAVRHEGYDVVFVRDGKVEHSYRREAMKRGGSMGSRKHTLGLHTKDERKHAYGLVHGLYKFAMLKDASSHDVQYVLGYTEAVLDLLKEESSDSEYVELMELLISMRDALLEKSAIPFSG